MTGHTKILVPIRYPLHDESARTLAAAGRLAQHHAPADIFVLHVNLFQTNENIQTAELTQAISSVLDDVTASVITRRGFFIEEIILEEAEDLAADVIVVGAEKNAVWRRLLRRLFGNEPVVSSYLEDHVTGQMEVIKVDGTATPSPVDA